MSVSIADLPVVDDLNVPVDPEEYVDQANPAPPKPGIYRLAVVKHSVRTVKDNADQPLLVDGKFPIIVLEQTKIVEPVENERQFGLFQDVRTKPFARRNAHGQDVPASDLVDVLRAFDATQPLGDFDHKKALLQQNLEQGATFVAEIGYTGYDKAYVEQESAKLEGGIKAASKDVQKAIYNKARLSTKDFVKNGVLQTSVVGPSGDTVDARVRINRYYPSNSSEFAKTNFQLGPYKKFQK